MQATEETSGVPARRAALWILGQVLDHGFLMAELVHDDKIRALSPGNRARAQRLASDVLRHLDQLDRLIGAHVKKAPPPFVQHVLRLGTFELAQGEAAYGVANDLVSIVSRSKRHGRLKGLVNAVLRKMAPDVVQDWQRLPPPHLPKWLRRPLMDAWGHGRLQAMERAHAAGAPVDLTVRDGQTDLAALAETLEADILPTGSLRLRTRSQISTLPGFEAGAWWVQDAAAALPARLVRGRSVLDMCAAPGGKTMQLAAMGRQVTALDVSEKRLDTLKDNLDRTRLAADLKVEDALDVAGTWDSVLLDAPCSGTGTIRRHPDLPHAKDGSEFGFLIAQQARLLDHALTVIPQGGQIVFCTCSLLPDEGEVQIVDALARHADLEIDREAMAADWIDPDWRSPEGGLRLRPDMWPDRGGLDGFYMVALRKAG